MSTALPPSQGFHYPCYVNAERVWTTERCYGLHIRAVLSTDASRSLAHHFTTAAGDEWDDHPHVLGSMCGSDTQVRKAALAAAAVARRPWRATSVSTRLQLAAAVRMRLAVHQDTLIRLLMAEGCPRPMAEWQLGAMLNALAPAALQWYATQLQQMPQSGPQQVVVRRRPDGLVCVDPPRNGPALCGLLGAMALFAGNTVVVRVPRSMPVALAYLLHEVLIPVLEADQVPAGVLNVVCAEHRNCVREWLESPEVADICYFGISQRGRSLERECVTHEKKAVLELSGNDGVLVWHDADVSGAAAALAECFHGSGQMCLAPNWAVVHPAIAEELIERLCTLAAKHRPGLPEDPHTTLSPLFNRGGFRRAVSECQEHGAQICCGGRIVTADGTPAHTGLFAEPTVVRVDGLRAARLLSVVQEETFFPLLPVVVPDGSDGEDTALLDAMVDLVNSNTYGLRNSVWARDPDVLEHVVSLVDNGGVLKVNTSHIDCPPHVPVGGGTGATSGALAGANYPLLTTTHLQTVAGDF
ncbi:aldehyde dehydrogenase family protein [Lipingzhangella sp. LS1_29]|uniref:Aldehyde dehydrogenase family protein n=1 Tax=Lipingzhangella rawalii TaxID=2055835 RepID=A0ABU2H687_9ACTN|nr:aldehyde dehydrogenase family protein [Lipingzhangella rawalii]MDS1270811.1 aldehyde dehydrogenase family protein [Lipingzhangella rawalii]